MEVEAALDAGILRFLGLEAPIARIDVAFEHELAIGERHGIHRARLDEAHGRALHRAGDADLVAAHGQDGIIEARAGKQRACRRHAEAHGDRHRLLRLVVFVDDLPHVGAGRDLKRADIAPAEIHAVVAEVGAAIEFRSGDAAYARAHCELGLVGGVPDRHHVLVHIFRRLDHVLLAGGFVLGDLDRLERMAERIGKLLDPLGIILPAEHLVDHLHVAEQVRKHR